MSFSRMTGQLSNSTIMKEVMYANQNVDVPTDENDGELLYYENGAPASSPSLSFDGTTLNLDGGLNVNGGDVNITGDLLQVGFSSQQAGKGVQLYAVPGASDIAIIDLHSKPNPGTQTFDVRIQATGGTNNVDGKGALNFFADGYGFNGNTSNSQPISYFFGDTNLQPTVPALGLYNQGRQMAMQHYFWSGSSTNDPTNPSRTIFLQDQRTAIPLFGTYNVSISSGFAGTGYVAIYTGWLIGKNASPATGIVQGRNVQENAGAILYAQAVWNAGGFPQLNIYNKQAGTSFVYTVEGWAFPNNDGF